MSNLAIFQKANAKINLALHVTSKRADGYHLLDSLVCFVEYGDDLSLSPIRDTGKLVELGINGEFADDLSNCDDNLVTKAARALARTLSNKGISCPPAKINLQKNLPVASGIGGGSADAAAALNLLHEYWGNLPIDLAKLAISIGADVPMCLDNTPKRVQGIGEKISPFHQLDPHMPPMPIVLINCGEKISTPQVFNNLANKNQQPIAMNNVGKLSDVGMVADFLQTTRNDLQPVAVRHAPAIALVLNRFEESKGCLLARMTGSGATCFGLFDTNANADKARASIAKTHPDWWCVATNSVPCKDN